MRCATLCAELRAHGHQVTVVTREMSEVPRSRFESAGVNVVDLGSEPVFAVIAGLDPDVVIVDGYHLVDEVLAISDAGFPLMLIDDNYELPAERAVLVLNQNPHATLVQYPPAEGRYLLGPSYALIRSDVVSLARAGTHPVAGRVLVALGGTDPAGLTLPIVNSLSAVAGVVPVVAFGDGHPDFAAMSRLCAAGVAIRASSDLGDAFDSAQLAIAGAGSMLWELALLGIPTIAVVVADNQVQSAAEVAKQHAALVVDARECSALEDVAETAIALLRAPNRLRQLTAAGRALVDGQGPGRVVRAIEALAL